jgi:anti-sigma regulatory factor (Ser/Thr protein kinase)/ActR/RegA family two-component response regulator
VLVVADLEMNWMLFDYLVAKNWSVDYVAHNDLALAAVKRRPYDLVVTAEVSSAREDLELLRQIRAVRPHTRMIVLTSYRTTKDAIAALREKAFSLFSKPYSLETLKGMIDIAMEEPCWDDGIEVLSATPSWIRLMIRCDRPTIERMTQFFQELADLPEPERCQVAAAVREMLLNAAEHGAAFDPEEYVEVSYLRARHAVACRVTDPGPGFKRSAPAKPRFSDLDDRPAEEETLGQNDGGSARRNFGILMAQHFVDELIYNEQGNEVMLIKYLHVPDQAMVPDHF